LKEKSQTRYRFSQPLLVRTVTLSMTAAAVWVGGNSTAFAQELTAQGLNQRIIRLERVLDNSVLIDMVQRIEALQTEVRQLRGELEQKTNSLESMRERQRKLYLDTDGRLQALEDYQNAYDLLIMGRNREAIGEFDNFLSQYPDGTYTDNAHYWLGEANYVERRFDEAIDRFNVVIFQFPGSRKVPDARLRKGFALFELQRYPEARQELSAVEAEYRGRSIAALARRRIEQMNNAGL